MAAYAEIVLDQGATFSTVITVTDDTLNLPANIANYNIISYIRKSYYTANATANMICTIIDASNGNVSITLDANTTSNIKAGRYVYDVKATDTGGVVTRILEGIITVNPQATY